MERADRPFSAFLFLIKKYCALGIIAIRWNIQICHDTVKITCAVGEQKQDAGEEAAPTVIAC
jgi:hypothetical protein